MAPPKRHTTAPKRRGTAPKRRPTAKKRKPLPPWLLLGGGLLVGIASVLVFNAAKEVQWDALWGETPPPKTASSEPAITPRFDFYTILPSQEVVVPDRESPARKKEKPDDKKTKPVPEGVYYLQVGSFRKADEASGMRARVILLGTEASIQSVTIDRDTWHRVRVGPYKDLARLREVRQRLRDNKIETLLIRAHK